MSSLTVRIGSTSRDILREIAAREGASMQTMLEKAIEAYRRQSFLHELNSAYVALRRDPKKWLAIAQERSAWDATLRDGLEERKTATRRKRAKSKSKGTKRHG
jgi:hypothetical protein